MEERGIYEVTNGVPVSQVGGRGGGGGDCFSQSHLLSPSLSSLSLSSVISFLLSGFVLCLSCSEARRPILDSFFLFAPTPQNFVHFQKHPYSFLNKLENIN